ncbi:MAG: Sec-independent protein translocase protein TatB, partial [Pseudomonas sp.]
VHAVEPAPTAPVTPTEPAPTPAVSPAPHDPTLPPRAP